METLKLTVGKNEKILSSLKAREYFKVPDKSNCPIHDIFIDKNFIKDTGLKMNINDEGYIEINTGQYKGGDEFIVVIATNPGSFALKTVIKVLEIPVEGAKPVVRVVEEVEDYSPGCDTNLKRMASRKNIDDWDNFNGSGKVYQDTSFGATYESLLWTNFLVDLTMLEPYRTVEKWARPKDLVKNSPPTFWGKKGILPDGVV